MRGHVLAEASQRELGKPYRANAPELLLRVLATLTALRWVPAYHQAVLRVALARGERPPFATRLVNRLDRVIDLPLSLRVIPEGNGQSSSE